MTAGYLCIPCPNRGCDRSCGCFVSKTFSTCVRTTSKAATRRSKSSLRDERAVQHLHNMNWILHKMIQSHKKSDEPDMQGACIVCHQNPVTEVLLPCRHVCFCSICIKNYTGTCPICRISIEATCNAHVYNTRMSDKANKLFYQTVPFETQLASKISNLRVLIQELC